MEARTRPLCLGHHSDSSLKAHSCDFCSKFRYSFIRGSPLRFPPTGKQSTTRIRHTGPLNSMGGAREGGAVLSCADRRERSELGRNSDALWSYPLSLKRREDLPKVSQPFQGTAPTGTRVP